MLTEKYYKNYFTYFAPDGDLMDEPALGDPSSTDDSQEASYEPGMVIIEEQTVTMEDQDGIYVSELSVDEKIQPPPELAISFNGASCKVPRTNVSRSTFVYGNIDEQTGQPDYSKYPFLINADASSEDDDAYWEWVLMTPSEGTYIISAIIPDGKGIPKIIRMGKPNTIVNQVEEIIKSLGGTVDKKRRNLQNLISTLAEMAENGEIGGKTEVKSIRGTVSFSKNFHMDSLSVIRERGIQLPTWGDVPDDYQASENKIVVWSTNATLDGQALASPVNVVWSDLNLNNLIINSIAFGNPDAVSKEFNQLTAVCTIYYW